MLRLDKTVSRKIPLHYDEDAENRARWQGMSFAEKRDVVEYLRHQAKCLQALCESGREQDRNRNATDLTTGKTSK